MLWILLGNFGLSAVSFFMSLSLPLCSWGSLAFQCIAFFAFNIYHHASFPALLSADCSVFWGGLAVFFQSGLFIYYSEILQYHQQNSYTFIYLFFSAFFDAFSMPNISLFKQLSFFSLRKQTSALEFMHQNQPCQGQNPPLFQVYISWIYNVGQLFLRVLSSV